MLHRCGIGTPHLSLFKRIPNQTNKTQEMWASSVPSPCSAGRMPCDPQATWVRLTGSDPDGQEQPKAGRGACQSKVNICMAGLLSPSHRNSLLSGIPHGNYLLHSSERNALENINTKLLAVGCEAVSSRSS